MLVAISAHAYTKYPFCASLGLYKYGVETESNFLFARNATLNSFTKATHLGAVLLQVEFPSTKANPS